MENEGLTPNVGAVLVFAAGTKIGALPVRHVLETMRPLPIDPLPGSAPFVDGLAMIRGQAVPVLNVAALLSGAPDAAINRFVTLRVGDRTVALAVSNVLGVAQSGSLNLTGVPPLLDGRVAQAVESIGRLDSQLLLVLNEASLVPPEAWADSAGAAA